MPGENVRLRPGRGLDDLTGVLRHKYRRAFGVLCVPGVALGLLMTVGSRLWLCPVCGGIGVVDLWVISTVVFAMVLATVCAVAIPALRAAAVEPWRVLRSD